MTDGMKDSLEQVVDLIGDILSDRTIAFRRDFVEIAGSAAGALFLSQAVYWTGTKLDGWFYKSRDEWTSETGLTRYEQESARVALKKIGVLEEIRKGCPFQLHFKINVKEIYRILSAKSSIKHSGNNSRHSVGSNLMDGGSAPVHSVENNQPYKEAEITTENTSKITHKTINEDFSLVGEESNGKPKKRTRVLNIELPPWLPLEEWNGWLEMRIKMRKAATDLAKKYALEELDTLRIQGENVREVIRKAISKNWLSFYAVNNGYFNGNGSHNGQQSLTNGAGATTRLLDHLPGPEETQRRREADNKRLEEKRMARGI